MRAASHQTGLRKPLVFSYGVSKPFLSGCDEQESLGDSRGKCVHLFFLLDMWVNSTVYLRYENGDNSQAQTAYDA